MLQRAETHTDLFQQRFRLGTAAGFFPHPKNVAPDVAQILRVEAKNIGAPFESRQRRGKIVGRRGANMAQVLSDDQIRCQSLQDLGIDGIQAFAAVHILAHEPVNFHRRSIVRQARMNDHRLRTGARREIALVAYAHNFPIQAECKENLSSRREQRDDSHDGRTLTQFW